MPRIAVISDVHANREALDAVLEKIASMDCEQIVCLGDIVGYGAEPSYCLRRVQEVCSAIVAGNHDHAVVGRINIEYFNAHARRATLWTRDQLTEQQREYLASLPLVMHLDHCSIVHGSLDSPEMFDYIQTSYDAYLTMEEMQRPVCLIGHSHVPIAFLLNEMIEYSNEPIISLAGVRKAIINVGSVGQPRDNNPLASFAVFDTDARKVEIHRLPYDTEKSAAKIIEAGLPEFLAERLLVGK